MKEEERLEKAMRFRQYLEADPSNAKALENLNLLGRAIRGEISHEEAKSYIKRT